MQKNCQCSLLRWNSSEARFLIQQSNKQSISFPYLQLQTNRNQMSFKKQILFDKNKQALDFEFQSYILQKKKFQLLKYCHFIKQQASSHLSLYKEDDKICKQVFSKNFKSNESSKPLACSFDTIWLISKQMNRCEQYRDQFAHFFGSSGLPALKLGLFLFCPATRGAKFFLQRILLQARPLGFLLLSSLATLGVCFLTLPALARVPCCFPIAYFNDNKQLIFNINISQIIFLYLQIQHINIRKLPAQLLLHLSILDLMPFAPCSPLRFFSCAKLKLFPYVCLIASELSYAFPIRPNLRGLLRYRIF